MKENQIIHKLEAAFDVAAFKTAGLWYYPVLKNLVYFKLTYSTSGNSKKSLLKQFLQSFFYVRKNKKLQKTDILTVSSSTYFRKKNKTKFKDIFFYFLPDIYPQKHITNLVYFDSANLKPQDIQASNLYIPDFYLYCNMLKQKLCGKKGAIDDKKLLEDFLKESETRITSHTLISQLQKLQAYFIFFNRFLLKTQPKVILMVWHYNYWNFALTLAAKKNGIKVIEFQHGIISKNHLAYMYPKVASKTLFPDYIFTFGNYFSDQIKKYSQIFKPANVKAVGFPFLEDEIKKLKQKNDAITDYIKEHNTIVVMSQLTVRKELKNFVNQLGTILPDKYRIIYKTHPIEKDIDTFYASFKHSDKIKLISDSQYSSLELINLADWHFTVHSTTVFEALALGVKTMLLQHKSYSLEFKSFVDDKTIFFVKNPEDVITLLASNTIHSKANCEKFYKPNSITNIKLTIDSLLS